MNARTYLRHPAAYRREHDAVAALHDERVMAARAYPTLGMAFAGRSAIRVDSPHLPRAFRARVRAGGPGHQTSPVVELAIDIEASTAPFDAVPYGRLSPSHPWVPIQGPMVAALIEGVRSGPRAAPLIVGVADLFGSRAVVTRLGA